MALTSYLPQILVDPYDRSARLTPGLLVLAPLPVLVVCLFGSAHLAASSLLSVLGFCGIGFAMSRVVRNAGKRRQDALFLKWGGTPSVQLLRHRDSHFDRLTKERFHRVLEKGMGTGMPDVLSESQNPAAADEHYRAATVWLISQTRNTKQFPLVFKENIAFGFHRNCLGVRAYGIGISIACLLIDLLHSRALTLTPPFVSLEGIDISAMIAIGIAATMLVAWIFWLTETAARHSAFAYAERLIQACDDLGSPPKTTPRRKKSAP
jgi:hypothetical protein